MVCVKVSFESTETRGFSPSHGFAKLVLNYAEKKKSKKASWARVRYNRYQSIVIDLLIGFPISVFTCIDCTGRVTMQKYTEMSAVVVHESLLALFQIIINWIFLFSKKTRKVISISAGATKSITQPASYWQRLIDAYPLNTSLVVYAVDKANHILSLKPDQRVVRTKAFSLLTVI